MGHTNKVAPLSVRERWTATAQKVFVGRTITAVAYLASEEAEEAGWFCVPLVLTLDNGSQVVIQSDDEGNNGGAVLVVDVAGGDILLPVIGLEDV